MKNLLLIAAILICVSSAASANASHISAHAFTINGPYSPTSGNGDDKITPEEQYNVDLAACQKQRQNTPGICTLQGVSWSKGRKGGHDHLVCRPGGEPKYRKCVQEAGYRYMNPQPDS
jgi:hypothetical protein